MMRPEADAMWMRRSLFGVAVTTAVVLVACGSSQPSGGNGNDAGLLGDAKGAGRGDGEVSDGGKGDANQVADAPRDALIDVMRLPGMIPTCTLPIQFADISTPTTVVGTGTAASCTEQALAAAVAKGGVVTFYCAGATIKVSQPIQIPIDKDTVIDGGNTIAIDGGSTTRIFEFNSPNFRATKTVVTLQNIDIIHGKATGTPIATAPAPCSQGFAIDGGGAGIFVRDGVLHVINVGFTDNHAAALGPDVGGGAIYAVGSLDVTVVGSRFLNNSGSNSGAIGSLNSDLTLVNDTFTMNQATGTGANQIDPKCTADGGQSGNGGNFGAVGIDGGSDGKATICGCSFVNNGAGALGGALGRTADSAMQIVSIDQTTFDSNTSVQGGGATYIHNCNLDLTASTFTNNSSINGGAIQADSTQINFVNDTFSGNSVTTGLGGALALFSGGGAIQSCTFGDNHADHGPGSFGAAIAGGVTLTINDTLFWNNLTMDCNSPMSCQDGTSTGQANLQSPDHHIACTMTPDPPCTTAGTIFSDALLTPIQWNGGPTQTMLPKGGSPALGKGMGCPPTDQRGVARPPDGCTIGAVEGQ